MVALAGQAQAELDSPGQGRSLECLEQDRHNLRAALDWCVATTTCCVRANIRSLAQVLWRYRLINSGMPWQPAGRSVATRRFGLLADPQPDGLRRPTRHACCRCRRPAVIVRCETAAEVQACILAARRHELPVSVRGGGHDWAGRALRHGGLVIDLSNMRQVAVDPAARVATVEGGATTHDVVAAATPRKLAAATGTVGSVGMAGLTLGGGYGPLSGRFGLALDNLLGAEVVLADGRLVTTDAAHEPELYWAIRGGGGNFGVVTSMRIRLHPLERLLAGFIIYPWSQAADVWRGLSDIVAAAPDELKAEAAQCLPEPKSRDNTSVVSDRWMPATHTIPAAAAKNTPSQSTGTWASDMGGAGRNGPTAQPAIAAQAVAAISASVLTWCCARVGGRSNSTGWRPVNTIAHYRATSALRICTMPH